MTWKPPLLPDHYAAGESQKSVIYSYLLFLWYVRLDRTGVVLSGISIYGSSFSLHFYLAFLLSADAYLESFQTHLRC